MTPQEMWAKALTAAVALKGLPYSSVVVGVGLPVEVVHELARLAGVEVRRTGSTDGWHGTGAPIVIESFWVVVDGVEIRGQGSRPWVPADAEAVA